MTVQRTNEIECDSDGLIVHMGKGRGSEGKLSLKLFYAGFNAIKMQS